MTVVMQPATTDVLAAHGVDVSHHWVADELYSKRTTVRAGASLAKHVHPFDHASALIRGTVALDVDGTRREVTGPAMLLIEAGKVHAITALTDVVWHCLHITDDTDPLTVDSTILKE